MHTALPRRPDDEAQVYPWERLWYARERPVEHGREGFTVVWEFERWLPDEPRLVPLSALRDRPCLVLLGDAGIGKSHVLRQEADEVRTAVAGTADGVCFANLAEYHTETDLAREVFEHPDVARWRGGEGNLHLFLDAYDEGRIGLRTLSAALRRALERLDPARLLLRIASRPSLWSPELSDALAKHFGAEHVRTYVLAPLTVQDVAAAASVEGVDADAFLREVERLHVGPLAARPLTLRMILEEFRATGRFPESQPALYHRGSLRLCEEWRPSRQYPWPRRLGTEQMVALAARIAAATVLSGRPHVWTVPDHGSARDRHVTVPELCADPPSHTHHVEAEVWETLESGLFTGEGPETQRLTHRSYAEFLTAWHLKQQGVGPLQLRELLAVSLDGEPALVPHLVETAAWLEALSPGSVHDLLLREPEEWVMSSAMIPEDGRAAVTTALLERYDSGEEHEHADAAGGFAKLDHPLLSAQLRPYLTDASRHWVARRAAARIAGACGVKALGTTLADLALDPSAPPLVRQAATRAVGEVGLRAELERLRPLALDPLPEDADDEIKGAALEVLWPEVLLAEEVLGALTPRKARGFAGSYSMFVHVHLPAGVRPEALAETLGRVTLPRRAESRETLADAARALLRAALPELHRPEVLSAAAELALQMQGRMERLLSDRSFSGRGEEYLPIPDEQRRLLIEEMVSLSLASGRPLRPGRWRPRILKPDDEAWLAQKARAADGEESATWSRLREACAPPEEPAPRPEPPAPAPQSVTDAEEQAFLAALDGLLNAAETDAARYLDVERALLLGPGEEHASPLTRDLTRTPGWIRLDAGARSRVVAAAGAYLVRPADGGGPRGEDPEDPWLPARALALVHGSGVEHPPLDEVVWTRVGPLTLWNPADPQEEELQRSLVREAYRRVPDAILRELSARIGRDHPASVAGTLWTLPRDCWDARALEAVRGVAGQVESPEMLAVLLAFLLRRRDRETLGFLRKLLEHAAPPRRAAALVALAGYRPGVGGAVLVSCMRADDAVGGEAVDLLVDHGEGLRWIELARSSSLADLFLWMASGPTPIQEDGLPTYDRYGSFRDDLLRELVTRGAFREIRRIADALPQYRVVRMHVADARRNARRITWRAPAPTEVLRLTTDRRLRLVRDADDLLEVVIDALAELQQDLRGELQVAQFLWESPRRTGRKTPPRPLQPKDEESLSDLVRFYLTQTLGRRGIVLNREVQIRRTVPGRPGERLDIRIDAVGESRDVVSLIVEVKGSWNAEWDTAMQAQLVDRYLKENRCRHGLYLVGHFGDGQRAGGLPLADVRTQLEEQAKVLTTGDRRIRAVVLDCSLQ